MASKNKDDTLRKYQDVKVEMLLLEVLDMYICGYTPFGKPERMFQNISAVRMRERIK